MKKKLASTLAVFLVMSLMFVGTVSAASTTTQVDNVGANTVRIFGTVEPTIVSIDVSLSAAFAIKPNEVTSDNRFISPEIKIQNKANVPVKVSVRSIKHVGSSPAVVDSTKYTAEQWDALGLSETGSNISLGLKGTDVVEFWFSEESKQLAPISLGVLSKGQEKKLSLVGKYGLTWSATQQLEYDLVFLIELVA